MRYRPITRNREFGRAYARGRSYVHPKLVLYVNKNRLGHTRVGLTATKKVGGAVQRNRAKRLIRAAWRQVEPEVPYGWDFIFVARSRTARAKMPEVRDTMASQLRRLTAPAKKT